MIFPLMKLKAGDQESMPAIKIAARARTVTPLTVKQEFISSTGLSALGKKRTRAILKPMVLSKASSETTEIIAAPKPTSASV